MGLKLRHSEHCCCYLSVDQVITIHKGILSRQNDKILVQWVLLVFDQCSWLIVAYDNRNKIKGINCLTHLSAIHFYLSPSILKIKFIDLCLSLSIAGNWEYISNPKYN